MAGLGALTKLLKSMREEKYVPREEIKEIGKQILSIPNDQYFQNVKGPIKGKKDIQKAYDVTFSPKAFGPGTVVPRESLYDPDHIPAAVSTFRMKDFLEENKEFAQPGDVAFWRTFDPEQFAHQIDVSGAPGNVNRSYPAIWEHMSGPASESILGPTLSLIDQLTPVNQVRRAMHQSDAMKRNPDLTFRLPPGAMQTGILRMTPAELYYGKSPESMVGGLWLSSAAHGLGRLPGLEKSGVVTPHNVEDLYHLNIEDPLSSYQAYAKQHGERMGHGAGLGEGAIRRLNLIEAILQGKFDEVPPEVKQGLGYRKGGLAQACSCGKH